MKLIIEVDLADNVAAKMLFTTPGRGEAKIGQMVKDSFKIFGLLVSRCVVRQDEETNGEAA